jgi:hypothetical protein
MPEVAGESKSPTAEVEKTIVLLLPQALGDNIDSAQLGATSTETIWREVLRLAYKATEIMGGENKSWHGPVRRYRDEA